MTVDTMQPEIRCKECGSDDVYSYEASTKTVTSAFMNARSPSLLKLLGFHRRSEVYNDSFRDREKSFILLKGKHYCPRCKDIELTFKPGYMFD